MRRAALRASASVASSSTTRAAALAPTWPTPRVRLWRAVPLFLLPSPSIRGLECVSRVFGPVQGHEELLHIPIHAALAHLVGLDLDERVVSALGLRGNSQGSQRARECSRPGSGGA